MVRNHIQGYYFGTPRRNLNSDRIQAAKAAVAALGLDFGAVDLIIGEDNRPYVLEVNSAPALTAPSTLRAYAEAFSQELGVPVNEDYLARYRGPSN